MAELVLLILMFLGAPIVAAAASALLMDLLLRGAERKYWPLLAGWWFPLLLLAYGLYSRRTSTCEAGEECGGLGAALVGLFVFGSILTGLLLGPFAARLTLRYLRRA